MKTLALLLALPSAFAIEDVRVEVGNGQVLERATVVVGDDGRIEAVGKDVKVPAGAERIDGKGRVLTPGFIETLSQLGNVEVLAEETTNDHGLAGLNGAAPEPTPALCAADGFNPYSVRIPITREEGVAYVVTSPTGGTLFHGLGYLVDLSGTPESRPDPKAPVAMFGALGERAALGSGNSRGGVWLRLRQILADVRFYAKNKRRFEQGEARPLSLSPLHLEALIPVVNGKLPLVLEVNRASDLLAAIRLKEEEGIDVIVAGGAEAWLVRQELAKAKVPVILQPSEQGPRAFETLRARDDTARLLEEAGVELILSAGDDWDQNARRLRQEAGIAVAHGLSRQAALRAITERPARLFGKGRAIGTIEKGKQATLVLWSGDPFELSSVVLRLWIDGKPTSLDNRQRELAKRYLSRSR